MTSGIVFTRPGGFVSVCWPDRACLHWLAHGGYWAGAAPEWLEEQVDRHVRAGHREHAVRRYIRAMREGGCTTAEAYGVIRDRDCGHRGSGFEMWRAGDLPDRWFRAAWRRSPNGGPILIDMGAARDIQLERIGRAIDRENARRRSWVSGKPPLDIAIGPIRDKIHRADEPGDLRRIWPEELAA